MMDEEKKETDELIGKISANDRSALGILYERFKSPVSKQCVMKLDTNSWSFRAVEK